MKINTLLIFFLLTIVFENNQTRSKFKKKYKKNIFNKNKSLKKTKKNKKRIKKRLFLCHPSSIHKR